MTRILALVVLVAGGCSGRQPTDSVVELWDVGNVFVQPQQTLVFSLRADGRVVAREDASGRPNLDLTLTQVPKARPLVGQIDAREAARVLRGIEKAGVLKADRHSGIIFVDGPCVRLVFRCNAGSNEIQHVALDDTRYHDQMNTSERNPFGRTWDQVASLLRGVNARDWRPLRPEDGVKTEVPWKREGPK